MNWVILIMFGIVLAGCSHIDTQRYSDIDLADKSITVPPGSKGLKGKLKTYLNSSGWRLAMNEGTIETTGTSDSTVNLKHVNALDTRYRLSVTSRWADTCMDFTDKVIFDLSVIDNKNGTEVFTMSGKGCESDIVESFNNFIIGKKEFAPVPLPQKAPANE